MSMFWIINRHILSWYQISSRVSHYSSCIYATVQDKNFHLLFPNRHSQCSLQNHVISRMKTFHSFYCDDNSFSIKLRGIIPNMSTYIKEKGIKRTLLHV